MTDATIARRQLGDTLVLGVGRTGRDVALYLQGLSKNRVSSVTVYGGAASCGGQVTRELKAAGIRVILGTDEIKDEKRYDLAVASPGIPEDSPFFQSARAHATEKRWGTFLKCVGTSADSNHPPDAEPALSERRAVESRPPLQEAR